MTEFNINILKDYRMQWALNREMIINETYYIKVNLYKLASNSTLFYNLLREGINHIPEKSFNYKCENVKDAEFVIYFCHMETCKIAIENLKYVFYLSFQYGLQRLQQSCKLFVKKTLATNNELCWKLWKASQSNVDLEAYKLVENFILENFDACTNYHEFYQLSDNELLELLNNDKLNVKSEYNLIDILCKWVSYHPENRNCCIEKLISAIRMGCLSTDELEELWKNNTFINMQSEKCMNTIHFAKRKYFRSNRNLRPLISGEDVGINNPRIPHEAIFVFGGFEGKTVCQTVRVYDNRSNCWISYSTPEDHSIVLPRPLMSFGISILNNRFIYIVGGEFRENKATQEVMAYDLTKQQWSQKAPMHEIRRDLAVVNLNKHIYAIGGDTNGVVLRTVECYDPSKNQWTEVAPMMVPRSAPAAATLNAKLYVCGGYTESNLDALTNSCELYDPNCNQWIFLKAMNEARYYFNAIAHDGYLYVLGGGEDNHCSVERFDPKMNVWEQNMPSLKKDRADFAACSLEGEIVCLGGGGETFCTEHVEKWLPGCVEPGWTDGCNLPAPIWGHRCVCVKGVDLILPYLKRDEITKVTPTSV